MDKLVLLIGNLPFLGSEVGPWTGPMVPFIGDLERSFIGDPGAWILFLTSALPSNPSVSEMRAESGLSSDSSSIGSRVRSSKECFAVTEGSRYPPIGPASVIGVEEVTEWRVKYSLHADLVIRVPGPDDRVSDFGVDEVPVYEGYFELGFRDRVPSLVAKISETLEISPGQLNPPAWRTLIALQNLGDLQGLVIGVAEVVCSYFVCPLNGAEWRYYLRPRGKEPLVREGHSELINWSVPLTLVAVFGLLVGVRGHHGPIVACLSGSKHQAPAARVGSTISFM
ncbi:hypothetical protein F2Q70_00029237 [Brassica cretica]|uniref:Uncharacterized protein n=1 Tax=Brassica cretica TaxID=69181 RepID=A0A8S9FGT8_BRACR|nr:hypothetical protein F2Q70_00029237 [Brassica cretica]